MLLKRNFSSIFLPAFFFQSSSLLPSFFPPSSLLLPSFFSSFLLFFFQKKIIQEHQERKLLTIDCFVSFFLSS